jgi:hypothetical protein
MDAAEAGDPLFMTTSKSLSRSKQGDQAEKDDGQGSSLAMVLTTVAMNDAQSDADADSEDSLYK